MLSVICAIVFSATGTYVLLTYNGQFFDSTLKQWFSEPTEEDMFFDAPWLEWHGVLGGRNTTVTYMEALGRLDFSLDDYWKTA